MIKYKPLLCPRKPRQPRDPNLLPTHGGNGRGRPRRTATEKECSMCGEMKPLSEFYELACRPGKLHWRCKDCNKKWNTEHYPKYKKRMAERTLIWRKQHPNYHITRYSGLSETEIEKIIREHGLVCDICNFKDEGFRERKNKPRRVNIDHDHKTGKIRGMLCSRCNLILGRFEDNINLFHSAIGYLKKSQQ